MSIRRKKRRRNVLAITTGCVLVASLGGIWWYVHRPAPIVHDQGRAIENQYELTANDSGKVFAYPVTSRFAVFLDEAHYPKGSLRCSPEGVVGEVSNVPTVPPPLYAVRFEAVSPGTCTLRDGDFSATIVVYSLE